MTESARDIAFRKDLLLHLWQTKAIGRFEYLAGREWQAYLDDIQIQGGVCYDWDESIFNQNLYQKDGDLNGRQEMAFDVRRILRDELGAAAFRDLDHLLSLPAELSPRLDADWRAYVARLLQIVSVILDIQAGGTDFGAPQEDWEKKLDPTAELRQEQPWLFERSRTKGKPSANKIRGRALV